LLVFDLITPAQGRHSLNMSKHYHKIHKREEPGTDIKMVSITPAFARKAVPAAPYP